MSEPRTRTKYSYDGTAPCGSIGSFNYGLAIGRRTMMCDAAGVEAWGYTITTNIGWMTTEARITNGVTKTSVYQYNFDGSLATLTYPSGRTITYMPGGAGRPLSGKDNTNGINYATSAHYAAPGALAQVQNGVSLVSTFIYNNRLQPCWMYTTTGTVLPWGNATQCTSTATAGNTLDFKYDFGWSVADNGNVNGITNNRDTTRSQSFTYDQVNRIATAETSSTSGSHCWGEKFTYDQWANLWSIGVASTSYNGCTQENLNVTATASNQLPSSLGYLYDLAGNLTTVPPPASASYTYNAESQMTSAQGVTYTYDGDGKRVQKSNGKLYWYGVGTDPIAESDLSGNITDEYVFFCGKRIAHRKSSGEVDYYFADHLGSSRIVTNATGTILDDSDFYPFGGERVITSSSGNTYKFTGKERDSESGLDDFEARYYSSILGRFMSPDEFAGGPIDVFDPEPDPPSPLPYATITNPQSLNKYTYTYNNPLCYIDPDGHDVKDYLLLASGPNHVPNTPHAEIPDVSNLGTKETSFGVYLAYNTQATFDEGDNPADYKPLRDAYILDKEGDVSRVKTGGEEDPSKGQIANTDNSQFVFDSPGMSVSGTTTRAELNRLYDVAFRLSEKNTKTGQVSQKQFFYRVTLNVQNGKIVGYRATPISQQEFLRITGQDKKKKNNKIKEKKKDDSR